MVGHALQNAGERRVILLTVDERPTSDKVMDWAVANMYRVSSDSGSTAAVGARLACFTSAQGGSGPAQAMELG